MAGYQFKTAVQEHRSRQTPTSPDLKQWWESGECVSARTTRTVMLVLAGVSAAVGLFMATAAVHFFMESMASPSRLWAAVVFWAGAPVLAVAGFWRYGSIKADFMRRYQRQNIYTAIDAITTDPELQTIIRLNQARMDAYHDLTLSQAAHAYRNTQVAMAGGFAILVAGVVMALTVATKTGEQIVVGGLAASGTALSGYVVATFLRAQQEALGQLNVYFRQPLTNSYLLTAERWALKLPTEARLSTLAHMADEVVAQAFCSPSESSAGAVDPDRGHDHDHDQKSWWKDLEHLAVTDARSALEPIAAEATDRSSMAAASMAAATMTAASMAAAAGQTR